MSARIEGADSLKQKFDKLADLDGMTSAMRKACMLVEGSAKKKAPKDTGALIRSIESKVESMGSTIQGTVFTNLEYAPYVEYGTGIESEKGGRTDVPWRYQDDKGNWHTTSGQKAQPFMRPAFKENRNKIADILKEGINA